jgi:hypothetical protein
MNFVLCVFWDRIKPLPLFLYIVKSIDIEKRRLKIKVQDWLQGVTVSFVVFVVNFVRSRHLKKTSYADEMLQILLYRDFVKLNTACYSLLPSKIFLNIHTYETPTFYQNYLAMSNTAYLTGGKSFAVWLHSISSVNAINPLVDFFDIHGRKREVQFFILSRTTHEPITIHIYWPKLPSN